MVLGGMNSTPISFLRLAEHSAMLIAEPPSLECFADILAVPLAETLTLMSDAHFPTCLLIRMLAIIWVSLAACALALPLATLECPRFADLLFSLFGSLLSVKVVALALMCRTHILP